jgi:hypothetical protein
MIAGNPSNALIFDLCAVNNRRRTSKRCRSTERVSRSDMTVAIRKITYIRDPRRPDRIAKKYSASVMAWPRVLIFVFAVICAYVSYSAYTEIRLIRLLRLPASEKDDPATYQGHTFKNRGEMEIFIAHQQRNRFSGWTAPLEEWLVLLILAACASFLGSAVRYARDSLEGKKPVVASCLLRLAIGPCLMAVAWISDLIILEGQLRFRPETLSAWPDPGKVDS